MERRFIEVDGTMISNRFVKETAGKLMRKCKKCENWFEVNKSNFLFRWSAKGKVVRRVCKECYRKINEEGMGIRRCKRCGIEKTASSKYFGVNYGNMKWMCRECSNEIQKGYVRVYQSRHKMNVWKSKRKANAKFRARALDVRYAEEDMNELLESFVDNKSCPCCGEIMGVGIKNKWPSVDRIVSSKGYVKGNIEIICYNCNFLKSRSTLRELKNIVDYIERW